LPGNAITFVNQGPIGPSNPADFTVSFTSVTGNFVINAQMSVEGAGSSVAGERVHYLFDIDGTFPSQFIESELSPTLVIANGALSWTVNSTPGPHTVTFRAQNVTNALHTLVIPNNGATITCQDI
jgi:hypothetical protein